MDPDRTDAPPHRIRTGIGGWTFAPWRGGNFYPADLPHGHELFYASRKLPTIEVNGTFYRSQKPATYAKWRDQTPPGFLFSLKAARYCTHRRVLADAGESVARFVASGIAELGEKLGPLVWQLMPTYRFDEPDVAAFLSLLPRQHQGIALRHVLDVRHDSFRDPAFLALARRHGCAVVFTDSDHHPSIADVTADFVYARLMMASDRLPSGYDEAALDEWASRARQWSRGERPGGVAAVEADDPPAPQGRDVFVFFINGAKEKAPAAAGALLSRLGLQPLI